MADGVPTISDDIETVQISGAKTLEQAQRFVREHYGDHLTVFTVEVDEKTYAMDLNDFIKNAEIVE